MQEKLLSVTMHWRGGKKQHANEDGDQGETTQGKSKSKGQRNTAAYLGAMAAKFEKNNSKVTYKEQI